jgi:triacylglycerol esterase/lipase EstA (alpha/beta hydrolase family)
MSTRILLRWLLVVQAACALGFAWAFVGSGVIASWPLALLAGAGVVLLVRVLITANNFVMTARFSSITPHDFQLGYAARLRLFGEEFMATLLQSSWFMPKASARERIYDDARLPPVLLIHGYGCNSGYWSHLTPLLDASHISHASLDLEPILGAIDDYVPLVARAVESLCLKTNAPKVIIVAHSMGGLVARAYMRDHGCSCMAHIFTLGTPHHGTSLANMGIGRNAVQMRRARGSADAPESAWLRELAAAENAETRALITSLYTHHDNIVAPQTSSVLPGARSIEFGGVGHVAMGRNPRILSRLMQEIAIMFTR